MIAMWMNAMITEIILKIVSKRDVLISEKKIDKTNDNATNITLKLKFDTVSGWANDVIIANKFKMINKNRMTFLIKKTSLSNNNHHYNKQHCIDITKRFITSLIDSIKVRMYN